MRHIRSGLLAGLLAVLLLSSTVEAQSRWLYAGTSGRVDFYVDRYTVCTTVGGDLSVFVRGVSPWGTSTGRLVINTENRCYCWPDSSDPRWKAIPPESLLERMWSIAYSARYGN